MTTTKKSPKTVVKYQRDIVVLKFRRTDGQTARDILPPPLPPHQEGLIDGFGSQGEGCRVTCELLIA